jgi:hypothetical protein
MDVGAHAPHSYPLWIIISALLALVPLAHFCLKLPNYYKVNSFLKNGEFAFERKDYQQALMWYSCVLESMPSCQKAQRGLDQVHYETDSQSLGKH